MNYMDVFTDDGFNLSQVPHDLACFIPETETFAPVSIKIFTIQLFINKCFVKSCLVGTLNISTVCETFIFHIFN